MSMKKLGAARLHEIPDKFREAVLRMTPAEAGRFLGYGRSEIDGEGERVAKKAPRGIGLLTPRERAVYDLVLAGKSNPEIAKKLGLGVPTVYTYRSLNRKLEARATTELVARAEKQGLL